MLSKASPEQAPQQAPLPPSEASPRTTNDQSAIDAVTKFEDRNGTETYKRLQKHDETISAEILIDESASVEDKLAKRKKISKELEAVGREEHRLADKLLVENEAIHKSRELRAEVFEKQLKTEAEQAQWDQSFARMVHIQESLEQVHRFALHVLEKGEGIIHRLEADPGVSLAVAQDAQRIVERKKVTPLTHLKIGECLLLEHKRDRLLKQWETFYGVAPDTNSLTAPITESISRLWERFAPSEKDPAERERIEDEILELHKRIKEIKHNLPRGYHEDLLPIDLHSFLILMSHKKKYQLEQS